MSGQFNRNDKIINNLGSNLKKVRGIKNITQEELAFKAGVSLSQVARIETGKINTTISTMYALANALNIEVSTLVKDVEK